MTPTALLSLADTATPGPWETLHDNGTVWAADDFLAQVQHKRREYVQADARLIALAPDLARLCAEMGEALEAILEHDPPEVVKDEIAYDRLKEAYRDCARIALAKLRELEAR